MAGISHAMLENMFHMPLLTLPLDDDGAVVRGVMEMAANLHQSFLMASPEAMHRVIRWLNGCPLRNHDLGYFKQAELDHELSDYMDGNTNEGLVCGRSLGEYAILSDSLFPEPDTIAAQGVAAFFDFLIMVAQKSTGSARVFRSREAATVADLRGNAVRYPDSSNIPSRLEGIYTHWRRYYKQEPGFAGIIALAAIANLHPFSDGNGRTARIVFNWTLNQGRTTPVYLPLYELSALSRCGYLIRLRQAQYHGEWFPLAEFLCRCGHRLFEDAAVYM